MVEGQLYKMSMIIRDAAVDDLDSLVALNGEVQGVHISLFPQVFHETDQAALRTWFADQMDDPATTILVGTDKEQVVAYLIFRIVRRDPHLFCHSRNCVYVDHICVCSEFRRHGAARALLGEVAQKAKLEGISRIELDVWSDNKAAKTAFEALGFKTFNEKMYLEQ